MSIPVVTIKDIAREVGVSTTLVSFVMSNKLRGKKVYRVSEETEKKVLEVAKRLNYQPNLNARALRSRETRIIGVIISDIANKFYAEIARCISEWASQNEYIALFGNTDEDAGKLSSTISIFEAKGVKGFIIVPCEGSEKAIRDLKDKDIPYVLIDRDFSEVSSSSVTLDNFKASSLMVENLVKRGCRKIEMISYKTTLNNILEREKGYESALKRNNLTCHKVHHPVYGSYEQVESIIENARKDKVDGLVFATYRMALLGRKAMLKMGYRVPEDCKLACFNNYEEFDTYEKDIVYAKQPIEGFATEALNILISKIKGECQNDKKVLLPPEIITIR